jgi:2Fe-2S ferredoxin
VTDAAKITVRPGGSVFEAGPDESIMAAAQRNGFRWPTVCGGKATCRTCVFTVTEGAEHLSEPNKLEAEAMKLLRRPSSRAGDLVRLACQARTTGDLIVTKPGVRPNAVRPNPGSRQ